MTSVYHTDLCCNTYDRVFIISLNKYKHSANSVCLILSSLLNFNSPIPLSYASTLGLLATLVGDGGTPAPTSTHSTPSLRSVPPSPTSSSCSILEAFPQPCVYALPVEQPSSDQVHSPARGHTEDRERQDQLRKRKGQTALRKKDKTLDIPGRVLEYGSCLLGGRATESSW